MDFIYHQQSEWDEKLKGISKRDAMKRCLWLALFVCVGIRCGEGESPSQRGHVRARSLGHIPSKDGKRDEFFISHQPGTSVREGKDKSNDYCPAIECPKLSVEEYMVLTCLACVLSYDKLILLGLV